MRSQRLRSLRCAFAPNLNAAQFFRCLLILPSDFEESLVNRCAIDFFSCVEPLRKAQEAIVNHVSLWQRMLTMLPLRPIRAKVSDLLQQMNSRFNSPPPLPQQLASRRPGNNGGIDERQRHNTATNSRSGQRLSYYRLRLRKYPGYSRRLACL